MLCVLVESKRHPGRFYSLPVLMELYLNKATAQKLHRKHRKKTEIMLDLVHRVERESPEQKLHFLGDYGYRRRPCSDSFLPAWKSRDEPIRGSVVRTHAAASRRSRSTPDPWPAAPLSVRAAGRGQAAQFEVAPGRRYRVRMASTRGCFYQAPQRLVRMVAFKHIAKRPQDDVFFTTSADASNEDVVRWYSSLVD